MAWNDVNRGDDEGPGAYDPQKDLAGSISEGFQAIRERKAAGGPGWEPLQQPGNAPPARPKGKSGPPDRPSQKTAPARPAAG